MSSRRRRACMEVGEPANAALHPMIDSHEGRKRISNWTRPQGRHSRTWLNRIHEDTNVSLYDLWRPESARRNDNNDDDETLGPEGQRSGEVEVVGRREISNRRNLVNHREGLSWLASPPQIFVLKQDHIGKQNVLSFPLRMMRVYSKLTKVNELEGRFQESAVTPTHGAASGLFIRCRRFAL